MLLDKVYEFLSGRDIFSKGDRVLVALSGGADSTALLSALCTLRERFGIKVSAFHMNHNLRGEESIRDEEFCKSLCNRLGVDIKVVSEDVMSFCRENSLSTEEGARILRYRALEKEPYDKIATAHTLNDSFETCLFNLARGTALKGLTGISERRGKIVRPFIEITRAEIEEYLHSIKQDYVTDSTNLTNDYKRNFIRHEIVPKMIQVNISAIENFKNTARALNNDEKFLDNYSREIFYKHVKRENGYSIKELLKQNPAVLNRIAVMILKENNIEVNTKRINDLKYTMTDGKQTNLSKDVYCFIGDDGDLKIGKAENEEWISVEKLIELDKSETFFDKRVTIKTAYNNDFNRLFTMFELDCDKIRGNIVLRNRKSGDKVKLSGRQHTTLLKKAYNSRLNPRERISNVILSDSEGIIFVENFSVADRVKADENTKNKAVVIIE